MTDPRSAAEATASVRRRRLPQHDFVPMEGFASYAYCTYPDPDNFVSRICGMTRVWHIRDAEEQAAEAAVGNQSDGLTGDLDPVHETGPDSDMARAVYETFKPVTYAQAKAAARQLTTQTEINSDIDASAAWVILLRWAEQDF